MIVFATTPAKFGAGVIIATKTVFVKEVKENKGD